MDQDYAKDLSPEDKAFLSEFNEEYYGANLDYENLENNRFHRTEEEKKACTDRVNARNRCLYSITKATKHLVYENVQPDPGPGESFSPSDYDIKTETGSDPNIEDALIEYIDFKNETTEE